MDHTIFRACVADIDVENLQNYPNISKRLQRFFREFPTASIVRTDHGFQLRGEFKALVRFPDILASSDVVSLSTQTLIKCKEAKNVRIAEAFMRGDSIPHNSAHTTLRSLNQNCDTLSFLYSLITNKDEIVLLLRQSKAQIRLKEMMNENIRVKIVKSCESNVGRDLEDIMYQTSMASVYHPVQRDIEDVEGFLDALYQETKAKLVILMKEMGASHHTVGVLTLSYNEQTLLDKINSCLAHWSSEENNAEAVLLKYCSNPHFSVTETDAPGKEPRSGEPAIKETRSSTLERSEASGHASQFIEYEHNMRKLCEGTSHDTEEAVDSHLSETKSTTPTASNTDLGTTEAGDSDPSETKPRLLTSSGIDLGTKEAGDSVPSETKPTMPTASDMEADCYPSSETKTTMPTALGNKEGRSLPSSETKPTISAASDTNPGDSEACDSASSETKPTMFTESGTSLVSKEADSFPSSETKPRMLTSSGTDLGTKEASDSASSEIKPTMTNASDTDSGSTEAGVSVPSETNPTMHTASDTGLDSREAVNFKSPETKPTVPIASETDKNTKEADDYVSSETKPTMSTVSDTSLGNTEAGDAALSETKPTGPSASDTCPGTKHRDDAPSSEAKPAMPTASDTDLGEKEACDSALSETKPTMPTDSRKTRLDEPDKRNNDNGQGAVEKNEVSALPLSHREAAMHTSPVSVHPADLGGDSGRTTEEDSRRIASIKDSKAPEIRLVHIGDPNVLAYIAEYKTDELTAVEKDLGVLIKLENMTEPMAMIIAPPGCVDKADKADLRVTHIAQDVFVFPTKEVDLTSVKDDHYDREAKIVLEKISKYRTLVSDTNNKVWKLLGPKEDLEQCCKLVKKAFKLQSDRKRKLISSTSSSLDFPSLPPASPITLTNRKAFQTKSGLMLYVWPADVTMLRVDVVVNAANENLMHGGGVARAILDAAGPELDTESRSIIKSNGPIPTTQVVATTAGDMPSKQVYHTVGPKGWEHNHRDCAYLLQETFLNCLEKGHENEIESIAIPAISSGIYGVPKNVVVSAAALAIERFSRKHALTPLKHVHFVDIQEELIVQMQQHLVSQSDYFVWLDSYKNFDVWLQSSTEREERKEFKRTLISNESIHESTDSTDLNANPSSSVSGNEHRGISHDSAKGAAAFSDHEGAPNMNATKDGTVALKLTSKAVVIKESHVDRKIGAPEKNVAVDDIGTPEATGKAGDFEKGSATKSDKAITALKYKTHAEGTDVDRLKGFMLSATTDVNADAEIFGGMLSIVDGGKASANTSNPASDLPPKSSSSPTKHTENAETPKSPLTSKGKDGFSLLEREVATKATLKSTSPKHSETKAEHLDKVSVAKHSPAGPIGSVMKPKGGWPTTVEPKRTHASTEPTARPASTSYSATVTRANVKHASSDRHEDATRTKDEKELDKCSICLELPQNPKILEKCKHVFCTTCIEKCFKKMNPKCPNCGEIYGRMKGNQPPGIMEVLKEAEQLPGYEDVATIVIYYTFQSGRQTEKHPRPGKSFRGTSRRAYLPDNDEGRKVASLLQRAFDAKMLFTVGRSVTTGQDDAVIWNGIHHKTNRSGGPNNFGYPDPTYLSRVQSELAAQGFV